MRGLGRGGLLLAALAGVAGCQTITAASRSYDEGWARVEGPPVKAKALAKLPLDRVLGALEGWDWFELGRRFEQGAGGASRDLVCAAVFYRFAAAAPYLDEDEFRGFPVQQRRIGIPLARVRLKGLPPISDAQINEAQPRCLALVAPAPGS